MQSRRTTVRLPLRRCGNSGLTLPELLVVIGVLLVLAVLMLPLIRSMRENGQRTVCLSRMKQVASIIMQYSADNNNRLLPALYGQNAWMNDETWYEILDGLGRLPGGPNAPAPRGQDWAGSWSGIMTCPSRDQPAYPYRVGNKHAIHYTVNQNPGFLNRVNLSAGIWPTLASIERPSRTFLLGEIFGMIGYPNGENFVYPHPRKGRDVQDGDGMNLVFYDGHAEYFKGRLPALPGQNYSVVPYQLIPPEASYPWF